MPTETVELESSRHLYQPPRYRAATGRWHDTFFDALADSPARLAWDPAAILSLLNFNSVSGDRTLLKQITRRPWFSEVTEAGQVRSEPIPPHGTRGPRVEQIAARLGSLLRTEAAAACGGRREIYVLLSGGLDSRIVAGILAQLYRDGQLAARPVAVSWGLEDCRDVAYGRATADLLGFDWQHLGMGPQHLVENIDAACRLGALVCPWDLHRMTWFRHVSRDALVLGASHGDPVGRGETCGKTLLELTPCRPVRLDILAPECGAAGLEGVLSDLDSLRDRAGRCPEYVHCEHEDACLLGRGLADAMSLINAYCRVYQMFTHPAVFSYMWSIHPSLRTDAVYRRVLEDLDPRLAALPWARTNRGVGGRTVGARRGLRRDFHAYQSWIEGPLYDEIRQRVDPAWFGASGLFDGPAVARLGDGIRRNTLAVRLAGGGAHRIWLWLAAFRRFQEELDQRAKTPGVDPAPKQRSRSAWLEQPRDPVGSFRRVLQRSPWLVQRVRRVRRWHVRRRALRRWPPDSNPT